MTKRCRDCDARLAVYEKRCYACGGKPTKVLHRGRRGRATREDDRAILTLLLLALIFVIAPLGAVLYVTNQTQAVIARLVVSVIAALLLVAILALSQHK